MQNIEENRILKIGITGGIGSGKSEVCKILKSSGEIVIIADNISRRITDSNESLKKKLMWAFGKEIFDESDTLNRKKLADIVFADNSKLKKLNAIMHPVLFRKIDKEITELTKNKKHRMVFVEAAILFEAKMENEFDYIIVVDSDKEKRIERLMKRDGNTREKIENIIASQIKQEEKIKKADFVICNNGDEKELIEKVNFIRILLQTISA